LGRWWWPILTVAGFLAVVVQVLDHDDPAPGLAGPALVTIALAAAVVALLTIHRRYGPGPLARAVAEYTVVALLATLLAAPGIGLDQPQPTPPSPPRPVRPSRRPRPRPATTSPPSSGPEPRSSEP
jgi:peptidoglycan/LPS O-acetylase OafA/YrhL